MIRPLLKSITVSTSSAVSDFKCCAKTFTSTSIFGIGVNCISTANPVSSITAPNVPRPTDEVPKLANSVKYTSLLTPTALIVSRANNSTNSCSLLVLSATWT